MTIAHSAWKRREIYKVLIDGDICDEPQGWRHTAVSRQVVLVILKITPFIFSYELSKFRLNIFG